MILPVFFVGSAIFFAAVNYAFEQVIENSNTKENRSFENPIQCMSIGPRDEGSVEAIIPEEQQICSESKTELVDLA